VDATSQASLDSYNKNSKEDVSKRALGLINALAIVSETSSVSGISDDAPRA